MEHQSVRLENELGEYTDSWIIRPASGHMENTSIDQREIATGDSIQRVTTTPTVTPFLPASTSTLPAQIESVQRPQATKTPALIQSPAQFCEPSSQNFRGNLSPDYEIVRQPSSQPYHNRDWLGPSIYRNKKALSPGRADCLQSLLSLALPVDRSNQALCTPRGPGPVQSLQSLAPNYDELDDYEDSESVRVVLINALSLDRNAEGNGIPFILQAHAIWISRFLFEPLRVVQLARDYVFQTYNYGKESRWRANLLANSVYKITRSTQYDLGNIASFFTIHAHILRVLNEARSHFETSRELDRQYALGAMLNTYELISSLCQVGSLSSVLSIMELAAPVFRRARPDPLQQLINLPNLLATINMPLQYYGTLDVLLGVLTGRPTFFRYNVEFTLEASESLFLLEDGPGLRWLNGIPDRLLLTLAKMNALFEDFGSCVPKESIDELETEIDCLEPIVVPSVEPALSAGRTVVQQCWFLAALIYLYMGLCGATAADTRVAKVRTQFMRILEGVRPKRNPDLFLIFPMVILGVATNNSSEQAFIRQRLGRIPECSRSGTMGHDLTRMLESIWAMRRPTVWGDLRLACWEVSGM